MTSERERRGDQCVSEGTSVWAISQEQASERRTKLFQIAKLRRQCTVKVIVLHDNTLQIAAIANFCGDRSREACAVNPKLLQIGQQSDGTRYGADEIVSFPVEVLCRQEKKNV